MTDPYLINGLFSDLMSSDKAATRRVKVASQDSEIAASYEGRLYSIAASYNVVAGQSIGLNINPASKIIISSITTNNNLTIELYSALATGSADGIFSSANMNMCSDDESPTSGQVFYDAQAAGSRLAFGQGYLSTSVICCEDSTPCVFITNTSLETTTIDIQVQFEEVGERSALFGLTASTQLEPNTEMSQYG